MNEREEERRRERKRVDRREDGAKSARTAESASHPPYLQACKYGCPKVIVGGALSSLWAIVTTKVSAGCCSIVNQI